MIPSEQETMNDEPTDWDGLVEVPDSEEPTDDEE